MPRVLSVVALAASFLACSTGTSTSGASTSTDASAPEGSFCRGGEPVSGVTAPEGFCVRRFAEVGEPRALIFAPNGDLLVSAPSATAPGGATGGPAAILVLADDDRDGRAEPFTFAAGLPDVQGVALGGGYLYFTSRQTVWRTPFSMGQRSETGPREDLGMPARFGTGGRWTHGLARSVGGRLFTSRGEYGTCGANPGGEISRIDPAGATVIASGFRNPMYLRCHPTDEVCAATELGEDLTTGAREKLVVLRPESDYGYPCCFTKDLAVAGESAAACSATQPADAEFPLGDTPFGFDWERGAWQAPFQGALFVALHGSFYSNPRWQGARIVFANVDPQTRAPTEPWRDFLLGFGPEGTQLERPADVAFSGDGRMFFADDQGGAVYWIAPLTLMRP